MSTYADLLARLSAIPDHERFSGPPIDLAGLTPQELGALWPLLQGSWRQPATPAPIAEQARRILQQVQEGGLAPWLDSAGLLATLQALPPVPVQVSWLVDQASYLAEPADPACAATFEAVLEPLLPPEEQWVHERHALAAVVHQVGATRLLARLAQLVAARHGDALPGREFALLSGLGMPALFAMARRSWYDPRSVESGEQADPATVLADEPRYAAFAHSVLTEAAQRIDDIHAERIPYQSDDAFGTEDAMVLGLAARVAATRDEAWYPEVIARLLPGACVAPGTARTAPSQSLTIALGHAVEGVPTPESVLALREALQVVRHAGLQKKLARNLKPAERALVRRPEVALRLLDAGLEAKQLRPLLAQFLEASFVRPFALPYAQWRTRFLGNAVAAGFARSLVWQAGAAFMLDRADRPVDAAGDPVDVLDDAPVALWHPVDASDAKRAAWRTRILANKLRQPLRQVFREFYPLEAADTFDGFQLATQRLIGLARREGWQLDYDGLVRRFGDLRAMLLLDGRIYPGLDAVVGTLGLRFFQDGGEVPARILSEACRAVDLLVSVSAVALDSGDDDFSLARQRRIMRLAQQHGIDATRRRVIEAVLAPQIAAGAVTVDGFHVCVGDALVSIRTGRVVRDGAPVDLALDPAPARLGALPWLPYDEVLLERVVHSVAALLSNQSG